MWNDADQVTKNSGFATPHDPLIYFSKTKINKIRQVFCKKAVTWRSVETREKRIPSGPLVDLMGNSGIPMSPS